MPISHASTKMRQERALTTQDKEAIAEGLVANGVVASSLSFKASQSITAKSVKDDG